MSILSSSRSGQFLVVQNYMKSFYPENSGVKWEVKHHGEQVVVDLWSTPDPFNDPTIQVEGGIPCCFHFRNRPAVELVNFNTLEQFKKVPLLNIETSKYTFNVCDFHPSQIFYVRDNYEHLKHCGVYLPEDYCLTYINTIETIGYKTEEQKVDLRALVSLLVSENQNQVFSLEYGDPNVPYLYETEFFPPLNKVWKTIAKDYTDSAKWISMLQSLDKQADKKSVSVFYSNGEIYYRDHKYQNNWRL